MPNNQKLSYVDIEEFDATTSHKVFDSVKPL